MPIITLPDGSQRQFDNPVSTLDVAQSIGPGLAKATIAGRVDGNRVELRGFGAFSVKHREARTGRNPRTGESVQVEAKRLPFFKTGKALRDNLNAETTSDDSSSTEDSWY